LTKPIRKSVLLEALAKYRVGEAASAPVTNTVLVEEGMEDVVPGYLDKRRAEISTYRQALTETNFEAIRMLAHKMKGTGTGYGFPVLTELGSILEKAAQRGDAKEIAAKTEELSAYLASIQLEYSK